MSQSTKTVRAVRAVCCSLSWTSFLLLTGCMPTGKGIVCQTWSPAGTYEVTVTEYYYGGDGDWSKFKMDVTRNGKPFLSKQNLGLYYGSSGVKHGNATWVSDSILRSATRNQPPTREISIKLRNSSDRTVPYAVVRLDTVAKKGYLKALNVFFIFDLPGHADVTISGDILSSGTYFQCLVDRRAGAFSRFKMPDNLTKDHVLTVDIGDKPIVEGDAFQFLTEMEAKGLTRDEKRIKGNK